MFTASCAQAHTVATLSKFLLSQSNPINFIEKLHPLFGLFRAAAGHLCELLGWKYVFEELNPIPSHDEIGDFTSFTIRLLPLHETPHKPDQMHKEIRPL